MLHLLISIIILYFSQIVKESTDSIIFQATSRRMSATLEARMRRLERTETMPNIKLELEKLKSDNKRKRAARGPRQLDAINGTTTHQKRTRGDTKIKSKSSAKYLQKESSAESIVSLNYNTEHTDIYHNDVKPKDPNYNNILKEIPKQQKRNPGAKNLTIVVSEHNSPQTLNIKPYSNQEPIVHMRGPSVKVKTELLTVPEIIVNNGEHFPLPNIHDLYTFSMGGSDDPIERRAQFPILEEDEGNSLDGYVV